MEPFKEHFHQRALLAMETALKLHPQTDAWRDLEHVLRARLTPIERACLLASVIPANEPELLIEVFDAVAPVARVIDCTGAGMPGLPMEGKAEEAAFWADLAEPVELRAYCLATFKRMSPKDKADFLSHVLERSAA